MNRVPQKVKNRIEIYLLVVVFALTGALVVWSIVLTVIANEVVFDRDRSHFTRTLRQQFDTALVRVKDIAAFAAAGQSSQIATKLKQATRLSPYLREVGFFDADNPDAPNVYLTEKTSIDFNGNDIEAWILRMKQTPGLSLGFMGNRKEGSAFGMLGPGEIVISQSMDQVRETGMRLGGSKSQTLVSYVIVDLSAVVRDTARSLEAAKLLVARSPSSAFLVDTSPSPMLLSQLATLKVDKVLVASNLSLEFKFLEIFPNIPDVGLFLACLIMLALSAGVLVLRYERRSTKTQNDLREAADRERNANNAKSDFLANMSHEIRTPLNGVLGMAELLARTELSINQMRYTEQIRSSGSGLLAILNDILDMSKLEQGQISIDPVEVELASQLRDIVTFYSANAEGKGLELLIDMSEGLPDVVLLDPLRLRQILGNLVSNAIKFTHDGHVIISARFDPMGHSGNADTGELIIAVSDSGIGMTDQEAANLFQRFSQANEGTTKKFGGTGLGLAICKQLATAMGGSIFVSSRTGVGSTFVVTLPVASRILSRPPPRWPYGDVALVANSDTVAHLVESSLAEAHVRPIRFKFGPDLVSRFNEAVNNGAQFDLVIFDDDVDIQQAIRAWDDVKRHVLPNAQSMILGRKSANEHYPAFNCVVNKPFLPPDIITTATRAFSAVPETLGQGDAKPADSVRFQDCEVLLVDDNHVNLMIAHEMLSDLGMVVTTATDGEMAIAAAQSKAFDIIFMDCRMPVMDGYEATGILRKKMAAGEISRIPIVAVTANALKGDRQDCLDAGMDEFLSKPAPMISLIEVILRLAGNPEFAHLKSRLGDRFATPAPVAAPRGAIPAVINRPEEETEKSDRAKAPQEAAAFSRPVDPLTTSPQKAASPKPVKVLPKLPSTTATVNAADKVPLMDLRDFEATRSQMRNFDTLMSFYRNDTKTYLTSIRTALQLATPDEAILPAHTIKSSSKLIGATGLSTLAASMETRLRSVPPPSAAELERLLAQMERVFVATLRQIDAQMAKKAS